MFVSPAKTAEPIEMPFVMLTPVSPRNHVFVGGPGHSRQRGNVSGEKWRPIVKYRDALL